MFRSALDGLGHQPFVLLFLLVAGGYALGQLKVKGIGLGATASTLVLALVVSLCAEHRYGLSLGVPEFASAFFFNLFMFSVGMKVGPQLVSGLRRNATSFLVLGLLLPLVSFGMVFVVRALLHPAPGLVPGIFAGANTSTPGLGAAQTAFASTAKVDAASASANMSAAFAFSYCMSMLLFVTLVKVPDVFGAATPRAARVVVARVRGARDVPLPGASQEFFQTTLPTGLPVGLRAYEIERPARVGHSVGRLKSARPLVSIATAAAQIVPEVYDRVARDVGAETVDVVIHRPGIAGQKLGDLARNVGHGLYLNAMFRSGDAMPVGPETTLLRGDVLRVTGSTWRVKTLEKEVGRVVRASLTTDIATLALGLAAGALVGAITIPIGAVRLTLGTAVGLLLVGIVLSTLRTRYAVFGGPYPEPTRQLLEDLGLNAFVAVLGVNSSAGVVKAIEEGAVTTIVVGCLLVGFVPPIVGWVVGRRLLRMNSALLLGALAGGRCNSAGMRAARETTRSNVPAISYPVTFALSNVVLMLMAYFLAATE